MPQDATRCHKMPQDTFWLQERAKKDTRRSHEILKLAKCAKRCEEVIQ